MTFNVQSNATSGIGESWETAVSASSPLTVAIPPEFDGLGGGYSPEDFYSFALANCFIATFKVFAEKSRISFKSIHAEGVLTLDRDENGKPWMKHFLLEVTLVGHEDRERALRLLEKTSQSCMILNSVKTEKTFKFIV